MFAKKLSHSYISIVTKNHIYSFNNDDNLPLTFVYKKKRKVKFLNARQTGDRMNLPISKLTSLTALGGRAGRGGAGGGGGGGVGEVRGGRAPLFRRQISVTSNAGFLVNHIIISNYCLNCIRWQGNLTSKTGLIMH